MNRVSFLIPTRNGGEGFASLIKCIENGLKFTLEKKKDLDYEIVFLINGNPKKPLEFLKQIDANQKTIFKLICPHEGKVNAINYGLKKIKADIYFLLDDDILFDNDIIYDAINELTQNDSLTLISYQPRALGYRGKNPIKKIIYDIINIRSLKDLYKNGDSFICGRFLGIKKDVFCVPSNIMLEDLYLSIILKGKYKIGNKYIYYHGLDSLWDHIKRVMMLETGRNQVHLMFPSQYDKYQSEISRIVDVDKIRGLNFYYKFCYYSYCILRFCTNSILTKLFIHKTVYW